MKIQSICFVSLCFVIGACDFLNPARPTVQPDTEVFGHLISSEELPDNPGSFTVKLQVGSPRMVQKAAEAEGKGKPDGNSGIVAELLVAPSTVVLKSGMPATLDDFSAGSELVGIPVMGTTRMVGEKTILVSADLLCDFETYRLWRLPRLDGAKTEVREDPAMINSDGIEHAPVPLDGGRILYFSARLRQGNEKGVWLGARRDGLMPGEGADFALERTYRTEWTKEGWSKPILQVFKGLEGVPQLRISWVDPSESSCLVSVVPGAEGMPWVGRAQKEKDGWGQPVPITGSEEGDAFDAVFLAKSSEKIVFSSTRLTGSASDLFLIDPPEHQTAMPLEPRINSAGSEWGARIGPRNELYFCRGDRQMAFWSNMVHKVAPATPFRVPISGVAPTADGKWAFMSYSRLRPQEPDIDIWVAPIDSDRNLGVAVPVEDWNPEDAIEN